MPKYELMPSNKTSQVFFYAYILQSLKDGHNYIGYTTDLRVRLEEHQKGYSFAQSLGDHLSLFTMKQV